MKPCIALLIASIALTACKEKEAPPQERVRAVKTIQLSSVAVSTTRTLAGIVKSSQESTLSFRVGGRVADVLVHNGDSVKKDQVLARLERKDYRLSVRRAQAQLESTRSNLREATATLQRQQKLKQNDFVAQAAVEHALAAHQAAKSAVEVAETALNNAQQDLNSTELRAPFAGIISARIIEPFIEITAGLKAFELESPQALEVESLIPETLIHNLKIGARVDLQFPTLKTTNLVGSVSEIWAKAERGNAYPVRVRLPDHGADIRSGMTAQLAFKFDAAPKQFQFLIPLSALDMRPPSDGGKLHPDKGIVYRIHEGRAQAVEVRIHGVHGNRLAISDGLREGDDVIAAGAPFLSDGQAVKVWQPTYQQAASINQ